MLFVDYEVAGILRWLAGRPFDGLALFQLRNNPIDLVILVGGLFARSGNNQRGSGFVNQDGIDFVDDRVVVSALHTIPDVEFHVVAKVIESELVVGAVRHVGRISRSTLLVIQIMHDDSDGQA